MRKITVGLAAALALVVACGGTKEPPKEGTTVTATKTDGPGEAPTTTSTEEKKPEPKVEAPKKKTAKEVVTAVGAEFMFSLADSEGAKKLVDEDCGKKAKKDDKKLEACKKDAEIAGSLEGIRFEKVKDDWFWISFGREKDKEIIFNKVKFKIANEADDKLTLTPEGKDEGKRAMKTLPKEMVLEVPDESTVAMSDPKKGRLVFKRK